MAAQAERKGPGERGDLQRVTDLLGGSRTFRHAPKSPMEAHQMLLKRLPGQAAFFLIDNLAIIPKTGPLERVFGMSLRTMQRRKDAPSKPLSPEQSARAWQFATILAKATEVFGTKEAAERWMEQPAMGLNQQRPIDLLTTPPGVELVETFLGRLEHGVYA